MQAWTDLPLREELPFTTLQAAAIELRRSKERLARAQAAFDAALTVVDDEVRDLRAIPTPDEPPLPPERAA